MKTMKSLALIFILCTAPVLLNAQLKVFADGDVAIGGTSPLPWPFDLQVTGNSVFSQTQLSITSAAMIRGLNTFSTATTPDFTWFGNDRTGFFHPAADIIGFTIAGTERMRINSVGKLFIGTQTDYGSWVNIYAGNNRAIYCEVSHATDYQQGIVTKTNRALSVTYVVNYGGTDNFYVRGDGTACSAQPFYNWSDASFKENITPIDSALGKVLLLRGVYYNFKPGLSTATDSPSRQMGLVAQEVEPLVPEVVTTMKDGKKAIAYGPLTALLIGAIKEQNDSIKKQNDRINAMQVQLNKCCAYTGANSDGDTEEITSLDNAIAANPNKSYLMQNTPNPFNQTTSISYYIAGQRNTSAQLLIFDLQGSLKKTYPLNSNGKGQLDINASELSAGMYLYTLVVNGVEIDTKRMILTN